MSDDTPPARGAIAEVMEDAVRHELEPRLDELRRFVDRRLSEISAEISATVQMVDYSETSLSTQLASIQAQVARVLAPTDETAPTSGIELDAIVRATEEAANRIMDAAEAISKWVSGMDEDAMPPEIREKLDTIFAACGFQDLTGQRIRRTIRHLHMVEDTLQELAAHGAAVPRPETPSNEPPAPDLNQNAVDALLG